MSWEADVLSDTRKGFLIPDGIISVFTVSLTALIVSGLLAAVIRTDALIVKITEELDRTVEEAFRRCRQCEIVQPEEDQGSF